MVAADEQDGRRGGGSAPSGSGSGVTCTRSGAPTPPCSISSPGGLSDRKASRRPRGRAGEPACSGASVCAVWPRPVPPCLRGWCGLEEEAARRRNHRSAGAHGSPNRGPPSSWGPWCALNRTCSWGPNLQRRRRRGLSTSTVACGDGRRPCRGRVPSGASPRSRGALAVLSRNYAVARAELAGKPAASLLRTCCSSPAAAPTHGRRAGLPRSELMDYNGTTSQALPWVKT